MPAKIQKIAPGDPETKSPDLVAENIERLRELFPEAFTEGKIDFDVLKQLLGGAVDEREEKYGLNWFGKRRARQLALTPSTGTLRPCPEESVDWDTTQNIFIEGDNLEVLKLLQKSYAGKVKLIYIDPPYNTGGDFVYPDDFKDGIGNYKRITGQVDSEGNALAVNTEADGRFHTNWLNMMLPRLRLARTLLDETGAIFVSIDDREVDRLRLAMSDVFGEENLLACVIWEKVHTRKNSAQYFSTSHEYLLAFARSKSSWDRRLFPREGPSAYRNPDNDPKGPWKADPITAHNPYSANYRIVKPNGVALGRPKDRYWALSEKSWLAKVAANEVIWGAGDSYPMTKTYLAEVQDGLVPTTLWERTFAGDTAVAKQEVDADFGLAGVFEYPKPTQLLRRVLQVSSQPEDVVLDFFAGSGSTGVAAMRSAFGPEGGRRFILVQMAEPLASGQAQQAVAAGFCEKLGLKSTIAELTKERLRRAGQRIRDENPLFKGDTGFRVFKLDSSNIRAWSADETDVPGALAANQEHLFDDRTDLDVLFEVLLKRGIDLSAKIETKKLAGKEVHAIGAGSLFVCVEKKIRAADAEKLALGIVAWRKELDPAGETVVVFRDAAFGGDDVAKTNLAAILEQAGIHEVRSL